MVRTGVRRTAAGVDLPGVDVREAVFRPTHGAHVGRRVHGAQLHLALPPRDAVADVSRFDPLALAHAVIATVASLHPQEPLWREQVPGRPPFIDLLWGSSAFREGIEDGASLEQILSASPGPVEMHA